MRRAALVGVSALAVALAAVASTNSATRTAPKQEACGQTLVIVLFWPHGHGAIPSIGFAADRTPHVEIYKYGKNGYPKRNFLAYGAANGKTRFAKACTPIPGAGPTNPILRRLTLKKARAISCRLPKNAVVRMRRVGTRFQIDVGTPVVRVISAKLRKQGSTLDYSRASCNSGPAPH
jgi:hypothetical protein